MIIKSGTEQASSETFGRVDLLLKFKNQKVYKLDFTHIN